jgi:tRNA threonylcarbamoyladenosine biosynthesis protein TsaE
MRKRYDIDVRQAKALAMDIEGQLRGGEILALIGPLGSGKTTFTKALARALGVKSKVVSPTFILLQEHSTAKKLGPQKLSMKILHLDLYRIGNAKEARLLGLEEHWGTKGIITVIEWADKITTLLPAKTTFIYFHDLPSA